ncbi:DNA-processing protein DprA [Desulfobacula sp.]|uniref:DNA-processing protein DprA n=1 Tax=Desulfobacula sp. TaxID=2593537 RepID=UPI0025B932E5|nr:DNA-processing protein DprA [Desulfobacula sp.]
MYKKLIDQFQSPDNILKASETQLGRVDKISAKIIKGITNHKAFQDIAKKELDLIFKKNIKIITLTDSSYPVLLKQIIDPPPFLTYLGKLDNTSPCISVIGSRTATSYGLSTSENLSYKLAKKGFQIVSGLARGIDAMAHKGALKAQGKTIAVMGSGLNKIYPRENTGLFKAIAQKGTIFSEFKINTDPFPSNFPIRNRIIAGLSCGSIVVEAAKRSGSLITARLATEYNREVFAVPGSIKSKKSEGTHSLLKQGAMLVENEMDIVDELHHFIHEKKENCQPVPSQSLQKQKSTHYNSSKVNKYKIKYFLEPYPVHIDVLIEKAGMECSQVTSQLLDLELEGIVTRHQGNYYSISEETH